MNFILNIDILSVAIAVAANLLLGSIVFLGDKKNATSVLFLCQTIILSIWSILNYLTYQITDLTIALWIVRLVLFFAVPNSIIFLFLMYTFPNRKWTFPIKNTILICIIGICTMILTLTPYVFSDVKVMPLVLTPQPVVEWGMIIFVLVAVFSLPIGIYFLIKKFNNSDNVLRAQLKSLLWGVSIMFISILIFDVIFPVVLNNTRFVPLSAVFTFPFIGSIFYSIYKHKLFNIKVIGVGILSFSLSIGTFLEVIFAKDLSLIIFRSSIFFLVLIFSIFLLKGVLREVEQRERIQNLAEKLKNTNEDLAKANVRLQELDKMKTDFISLATHQIRAPLTAIKGYISLIMEGDYGNVSKEVISALDIVSQSTNNLVTIVGDFLDVSRIEQGRMKYEFSDFDLRELTEQVMREYKPNVERRGLKLNYAFNEKAKYIVHGDRGKIKQIIGNILDNSIKYTPKGEINISVTPSTGKKALIEISDTGVGIPKATIPKLFQKFTRAENANEANILGTGLGLYVAKQMMEAHRGRIWAESEGEGKGSQFYIEMETLDIPASAVAASQGAVDQMVMKS